jgi:hypothetical protein
VSKASDSETIQNKSDSPYVKWDVLGASLVSTAGIMSQGSAEDEGDKRLLATWISMSYLQLRSQRLGQLAGTTSVMFSSQSTGIPKSMHFDVFVCE